MMLFTFTAVCILLGLLYYHYVIRFSRLNKLTVNIPKLRWWPVIGSYLEFGRTSEAILQNLIRITNENGPVVAGWMGNELFIMLSSADDIQVVLTSNRFLKKGEFYYLFKPWLGSGLVTSHGDKWRKQRKIITPAFHFKILEQFIDVFSSNADILINKLKDEVGKPGIEITDHIALCTLDIICETSMGLEVSAQLQKKNKFVHATHDITVSLVQRMVRPWLVPNMFFNLSPTGKIFNQSLDIINSHIEQVINNKRKVKADKTFENVNNEDSSVLGEKKKSAFLDLLLEYNMSSKEIKDQVNTFIFGGHDTTTSAIGFVIYCLMKHPEVQNKVLEELNGIFGDSNRPATFHDLRNMKYLECVIQETLRLYTVVPYIGRKVTEDVQLSSNYVLPKGCTVSLFLYKLHHDPKLFPDPEVFNPDRFLPEVAKSRHPYAFCPFSAGPRNCIDFLHWKVYVFFAVVFIDV
ncbi:cytochrome P450 4C1-like isoform X2 [Lycorma delicatula]|uniref:cytochrome P450 4C1-like isoform X2 n=1 Tax=Lycorma delicatula TaxID=130591 RepID=UPI003F50D89D